MATIPRTTQCRSTLSSGFTTLLCCLTLGIALPASSAERPAAVPKLIVHEWGTFTTLQDERGQALGGINVDDEPLPTFVHGLDPDVIGPVRTQRVFQSKGAPERHPYVTMRLETPVMYFYPPAGQKTPLTLNVNVAFRGGWLTQFYPQAKAEAPGMRDGQFEFGKMDSKTSSRLSWTNLQVGTDKAGPETDSPVWIAPRAVTAASITAASVTAPGATAANGESERYLFYRGVGNFPAPLRVTTDVEHHTLALQSQFQDVLADDKPVSIRALWLIHARADGAVAYRELPPLSVTRDPKQTLTTVHSDFQDREYSVDNLERLKKSLAKALVADGLYADEAQALLNTWQKAYFQSPGLRLFFLVPRRWTDSHLPLELSQPADIQRVMVARIELTSPEQRDLLKRLSQIKNIDSTWMYRIPDSLNARKFYSGHSDFGDLGVTIPPDYQLYLQLGRFRNALLIHEEQVRRTDSLSIFINRYGLEAFRVSEEESKPAAASDQR